MPETQPVPHHPSRGAKRRRGGRRPGAGAPRGNLNALKPCPERARGASRRDGRHSPSSSPPSVPSSPPTPRSAPSYSPGGAVRTSRARKPKTFVGSFFDRLVQHARDIAEGNPHPAPSTTASR